MYKRHTHTHIFTYSIYMSAVKMIRREELRAMCGYYLMKMR